MNFAVVDASFVLSFLLPDEEVEGVSSFFKDFIEGNIVILAPYIVEFEVMNGLKSAIIRNRISNQEAFDLAQRFDDLAIKMLSIETRGILSLSIQNKISIYDAAYAWLAQSRGCELMTHDKKLAKIAKGWT